MTRLLEEVVEDVRDLPEDEQDRVVAALLKHLHYLQGDQLLA